MFNSKCVDCNLGWVNFILWLIPIFILPQWDRRRKCLIVFHRTVWEMEPVISCRWIELLIRNASTHVALTLSKKVLWHSKVNYFTHKRREVVDFANRRFSLLNIWYKRQAYISVSLCFFNKLVRTCYRYVLLQSQEKDASIHRETVLYITNDFLPLKGLKALL